MSNTTNPPSALSAVPAEVQASQAWATLTDRQRDLLVVTAAAYTGKNNGALRVPWAVAQKLGFESPAALGVDRLELVKRCLDSIGKTPPPVGRYWHGDLSVYVAHVDDFDADEAGL